MTKRNQILGLTTGLIVSIGAPTAACAQSALPAPQAAALPGQGPAASSDTGLAEIIVTAQKRSQRLQDVPISVTALSSSALKDANVETVSDLPKLVSGVVFQKNAGNVNIFMRGVGNPASSIGNEASVAVYIDGVYYSRLSPQLLELNNVERIEVLQGPQGTLFGRNADAGLIQVITKDPTHALTLHADLGYGNYNTGTGNLYASTGLTDTLAADISLHTIYQGTGWGTNLYTGKTYGQVKSQAGRTKWVFTPTSDTKITASADWTHTVDTAGVANTHFYGTHGNFLPPYNQVYPVLPVRDADFDGSNESYGSSYTGSLKLEQNFGAVRFVATSAFQRQTGGYNVDVDRTPQPYFQAYLPYAQSQFSQELQLSSNTHSRLNWTIGAFYMWLHTGYSPATRFTGEEWQAAFHLPQGEYDIFGQQTVNSRAVYAQSTYAITDNTNFTGGIRYTSDKVSANGHNNIADPSLGVNIDTGDLSGQQTFNKVTFRLAGDHHFSNAVMAYASFNRGFKAGEYNLLPFSLPAIKPEVLDAYEIGVKSELFDKHLRLNVAAFDYEVSNLQVQKFDGANLVLLNAGSARSRGVEASADAAFSANLTGHVAATYLDAKYKQFVGAPFAVANPNPPYGNVPLVSGDASGNRLPNSPKVTFTVGVDYKVPASYGDWKLSANYAYTAHSYFEPDNEIKGPAYGLLDAHVSFTPAGNKRISFSVWGKNLTNETYFGFAQSTGDQSGDIITYAPPRTYGVKFSYDY